MGVVLPRVSFLCLRLCQRSRLLEGEKEGGPLHITVLSVPYDNQKAVETADLYPDLPLKEAFQKEVLTGIYSR